MANPTNCSSVVAPEGAEVVRCTQAQLLAQGKVLFVDLLGKFTLDELIMGTHIFFPERSSELSMAVAKFHKNNRTQTYLRKPIANAVGDDLITIIECEIIHISEDGFGQVLVAFEFDGHRVGAKFEFGLCDDRFWNWLIEEEMAFALRNKLANGVRIVGFGDEPGHFFINK